MSKAWGWPRGWQMPNPCEAQNLLMPHPRDCQGGQMPCSSPEGEGVGLGTAETSKSFENDIIASCNTIKNQLVKLTSCNFSSRYIRCSQMLGNKKVHAYHISSQKNQAQFYLR